MVVIQVRAVVEDMVVIQVRAVVQDTVVIQVRAVVQDTVVIQVRAVVEDMVVIQVRAVVEDTVVIQVRAVVQDMVVIQVRAVVQDMVVIQVRAVVVIQVRAVVQDMVVIQVRAVVEDMVVIQIPRELKYTDYMVIVSSSSQRHRNALAELVRAAYKLKKAGRDPSVQTEGKGTNWVAMDMGNIVLHIMKPDTRESYDLETLWTVGAAFDEKAQVSEEDLVGVRRPRDPFGRPLPPPIPYPHQAVT
ncbi:Mitochondrial assembly of ribosomal large subunit protein 1 [Chionoecetes opilio]|uniref:Mitochondrial assembly of ribosomal large subunit protein 1 n=1 Tax=Chionoecetes opilio TaxID=41210 RepID=A0A8J4Y6E5_CHIOP|nr:Mitochondrial assembly of ribosomal large subunit protein 1 [Chionoecetes opilio]